MNRTNIISKFPHRSQKQRRLNSLLTGWISTKSILLIQKVHLVAPKTLNMKVLSLNRQFLKILGVCPAPKSKWQFIFKLNYVVVLVLQILGLISSIWFVAVYLTKDLNSVLYAGFHTSAYSSSTYSLIVGFVVKHKITAAFDKLQVICDESNWKLQIIFQLWIESENSLLLFYFRQTPWFDGYFGKSKRTRQLDYG